MHYHKKNGKMGLGVAIQDEQGMSKIWSFSCELLGYIHINGGLYSFWFESRFRLLEIDEKDE